MAGLPAAFADAGIASSSALIAGEDDPPPKPPEAEDKSRSKPGDAKKKRSPRRRRPPKEQPDAEMEEQVRELLKADPADRAERAGELLEGRSDPPGRGDPKKPRRSRRAPPRKPPQPKGPPADEAKDGAEGAPGTSADDAESSTEVNIPPSDSSLPPEQRVYSFSIKDGTYEQLIEVVARLTGLGVIGEAPKGGKVSFVADEELTFDELMARVRMLLFKYKPHEPYWLLREETHLEVIRVNDIYRIMPRDRMFRRVDEFRSASLPEHELALVKYTPTSGSVSALTVVRDFMPDYVRVTPMEDENTVIIFGLVSDIEKYLWLKDFFVSGKGSDPRTLEKIPVEHITPSEAVAQLRLLMDLGPSTGGSKRKASTPKGRGRTPGPLANIPEPEVSVLPSDIQKVIIVRAMKDKIEEIKELLPLVDVPTEIVHEPVVIPVKHTDPAELVVTIQQVLSASPSTRAPKVPTTKGRKSTSRSKSKSKSKAVAPMTADDITLMAHPTQSAILVMADEEGVARVRDYVEMFDVQVGVEHVRIELEHVGASEIIPTLLDLLSATVPTGAAADREPQLIPDPSGDVIWFSGSEEHMATVREMLELMDNAEDVATLHIVRLVNQTPSFVTGILEDYIAGVGAGRKTVRAPAKKQPKRGGKKGKQRRTSRAAASAISGVKITPDDEQGRLFVLCTDAEWEQYLPIIEMLENEVSGPEFVVIRVEHVEPAEAIAKITALLGSPGPKGKRKAMGTRFESTDGAILVMGASEPEIETIKELLAQFDRPAEIEQRTFLIKHGDPGEIADAIRTLVGGSGGGAKPRARLRGKAGKAAKASTPSATQSAELTIVELGDRLIVQAAPETMKEVAALIEEFDVEERTTEIRVYEDFPLGADIEEISATLSSMLARSGRPATGGAKKKGGARPSGSSGPQFIPQLGARRLVVIAEPAMFAEIEELLEVLRIQVEVELHEIAYIEVEHADPAELVEQIDPLLTLRVEQLIRTGRLSGATESSVSPPAQTPKTKGKRRGAGPSAVRGKRYHLDGDVRNRRIVISAPAIVVEEARQLVAQFDLPSEDDEIVVTIVEVEHADPEKLVETIEPLLALRVQQLFRSGELSGGGAVRTPASTRSKGAKKTRAVKTGGEAGSYHLAADTLNARIIVAGPQIIADEAAALIAKFDRPGEGEDPIEIAFVDVLYAEPDILVVAVEPLLDIKISHMLKQGELPDVAAPAPRARKSGKGGPARARKADKPYHLEPDVRNRRIAVAAVRLIIDEAKSLIAEFDRPADVATEFVTIELDNSSPEDMVAAIKQLIGQPSRPGRGGKGKGAAAAPIPAAGQFTIIEAPGGGAVVVSGPKADVEQAIGWIEQLDVRSGSPRIIKVYEIESADVKGEKTTPPTPRCGAGTGRRGVPGRQDADGHGRLYPGEPDR
jgi:type II secretory pathway component GspD/PulD (secretin)